jgi:hypothetical protein
MVGPMGQWPGEPVPPVSGHVPPDGSQRDPTPHMDPTVTMGKMYQTTARPSGSATESDGSHRKRRPAAGLLIGVIAVLAAVPVLRLLLDSVFSDSPSPGGVISSVLVLLALPLGGLGLHGLVGAVRVPDASASSAWLRTPVAYLTVALVLVVAAGLAAT